jgi:hypothetical protein
MFEGVAALGRALAGPNNNFYGIQDLYVLRGVVVEYDAVVNKAKVRTNRGVLVNVKCPITGYSQYPKTDGSGMYNIPAVRDEVLVGVDSMGHGYVIARYPFITPKILAEMEPHTYKIVTNAGDKIEISEDAETGGITISSLKKVDLKVENDNASCIISLAEDGTIDIKSDGRTTDKVIAADLLITILTDSSVTSANATYATASAAYTTAPSPATLATKTAAQTALNSAIRTAVSNATASQKTKA